MVKLLTNQIAAFTSLTAAGASRRHNLVQPAEAMGWWEERVDCTQQLVVSDDANAGLVSRCHFVHNFCIGGQNKFSSGCIKQRNHAQ